MLHNITMTTPEVENTPLLGKKALVVGIANKDSIAFGIAKALRAHGAEIGMTYLNEKAKKFTDPCAELLDSELNMPLDVTSQEQLEDVFKEVGHKWGRVDVLIHAIAFAPMRDLHGRVTDCSLLGFETMMDISVHSLIRMAKAAEPLMTDGGTIITLSYLGGQRVVPEYGVMGIAKAALEAAARGLAYDLGPKGIRVNVLSPGPIHTRAASGIGGFDALEEAVCHKAPMRRMPGINDIGAMAAHLAGPFGKVVTGGTIYMDGGAHIMA